MFSISKLLRSGLELRALAVALLALHISAAVASDELLTQVEDAARNRLTQQAERARLLDPQFEVTVIGNGQTPSCQVPVKIDSIDTRQSGRMRFEATCPGTNGWRREFIVRTQTSARVLVAAADIPAGQTITTEDLALERRTLQTSPEAVSESREIVGMSARRTLRAGDVVRKSWLIAPILVKRGDTVRILASRDSIEVSVAGVAMENGANGAVIGVRNTSSGSIIRARIISAGTVEPIDIPVSTPAHSPE